MKKKISMLLVVIMVMMMGMTSYAAQSPTTDTTPAPEDTLAPSYGNVSAPTGSITVNGVLVDEVPEISPVNQSKVNEAQKEAEKKVASTAKVLQVVDVNIKSSDFVQNVEEKTGIDLNNETYRTITIPFGVNGVVAGQKLVLLVQKTDGTWVTVTPDKVENGKVTATFDFQFRTVAFVAYNASAQTGEMVSLLPAMMVCLGGMTVCAKKAKKNN